MHRLEISLKQEARRSEIHISSGIRRKLGQLIPLKGPRRVAIISNQRVFDLYGREVVQACQERFRWAEMRAEHHVLDLLLAVWKGWTGNEVMREYLREDGGWFQSWEQSAFGGGLKLSILRPVIRFTGAEDGEEEKGITPEWGSGSVPYGWVRKEDISYE